MNSVVELGLSGDELFDPLGQDMIAVWKLELLGLNKFLSGELNAEEFGNNVAKEWASMPVLTDISNGIRQIKAGQSFYAGDGLNKALVGVDRLLLALNSLKPAP